MTINRPINKTFLASLALIFGFVFLMIFAGYIVTVASDLIRNLLILASILAGLLLMAGAVALGWIFFNKAQASVEEKHEKRAKRHLAEEQVRNLQADTLTKLIIPTVTKAGEVLHLTHLGGQESNTTIPLLAGSSHVNGHPSIVSPQQLERWKTVLYLQAPGTTPQAQIAPGQPPIYIEQPLPDEVRLLDYLGDGASIHDLFLGMGKTADGQMLPIRRPLQKLSHIAIGGMSGFGKSTLVKALAYQIINAKEAVETVMLDAQGVSFTAFDGHPNLKHPIAYEPADILQTLVSLDGERQRREQLFGEWRGIDDLDTYNQVMLREGLEPLPMIPILFDEFGISVEDKQVALITKNLSRAGRKVGMFCIFATQTWNADEVASSIKSNLATAIQLRARSKSQSRILLGASIASDIEKIGRAYAMFPGVAGMVEMQTPLINVMPEPVRRELPVNISQPGEPTIGVSDPTKDDQYLEVAQLVVDEGLKIVEASIQVFGKSLTGNAYYELQATIQTYRDQKAQV